VFLAKYDAAATQFVQGALTFPCVGLPMSTASEWWTLFVRLLRNGAVLGSPTVAHRLTLTQERLLQRSLLFMTQASDEELLRRYLGSFLRLDILVDGTVTAPITATDFDATLPPFPPLRIAVAPETYDVDGAWFACDFRIGPCLDDLLSEALMSGYDLAYQLHLAPISPDPAWLRDTRKNYLRIGQLRGISEAALNLQARLIERLGCATAVCEEFVGVSTPEAAHWLQRTLRRLFERSYRATQLESPAFDVVEHGYEQALCAGVHRMRFEGLDVNAIAAEAVDDGEMEALLGWRPAPATLAQLPALDVKVSMPTDPSGDQPPVPRGVLPAPYAGNEQYLFMSYKHANATAIAPLLDAILELGYRVWYDAGIPGASEWDAVIEDRLKSADAVVVFLSREAVLSKYVRREVKYADMINKPILTIKLEEAKLSHGLEMLLTNYQIIGTPTDPAGREALDRALRYLRHGSPSQSIE